MTAAAVFRAEGATGLTRLVGRLVASAARQQARTLRRTRRRVMEFGVRPHFLRRRVRHVYGPESVNYGQDELLVTSVVRNGALYVKSFMEHYQMLGVAHCVFLDNGSTDRTVEMLCAYPRVTVLRADAPYDKYENTMKRYLADRFSSNKWNLCVDIDELFDYPLSSRLPLADFLRYLNSRSFTAVVAQMLDMFSDVPLDELKSTSDDVLKEKYLYYDTSAVTREEYPWSTLSSTAVKLHRGGIRRIVFGTNNGLTKAALVFMNRQVKPFIQWHHAVGALVADVSCVLLHYPFVSAFRDKVQDAARTGRYGPTTTDEYVAYHRALARTPNLTFKLPSSTRFTGLEPLIAEGFLVVSDTYRLWVDSHR